MLHVPHDNFVIVPHDNFVSVPHVRHELKHISML